MTIQAAPALQLSKGDANPLVFATGARDRSFWLGLAAALAVHSLIFIAIADQAPRNVGSPGGNADAINVDLVDDADLLRSIGSSAPGSETPPSEQPPSEQPRAEQPRSEQPPAQAQAASPLLPPQAAVPEAPKPVEKTVPPQLAEKPPVEKATPEPKPVEPKPVEAKPAEPTPPEKAPAENELAEPQPPEKVPPPIKTKQAAKPAEPKPKPPIPVEDKELADLLSLAPPLQQKLASAEPISPSRPESKPESKKDSRPENRQEKSPRKQDQAKPTAPARPKIDLSLPSAGAPAAGNFSGRNAGFSRPEGITRSGENDDFARGVIRALRNTMPDGHGTRSRLTVRIILNENGNLAEVHLVHSSTDPALDQNVLFSIKQSNFPIPPGNLKPVDRVFLVTYVYN